MAFSIGDSVKVKAGVNSPDDDSLSIAGWRGRLIDIDEDEETIGIRWDSITLNEADESSGILVNVTRGEERLVSPLCDMTVLDGKSPCHLPIKDYRVWFANC